jgi:tripartite-type tricarboxylate transporter receptor subunit TctC
MSGVVQLFIVSSPPVAEQIKAGTLRGLAVASPERLSILPDVPTAAEQGLPDLVLSVWLAVMAPKSTPEAIVQKMNAAMRKAAQAEAVKQRASQLGFSLQDLTASQMDEAADREVKTWVKVIRENNIKFD